MLVTTVDRRENRPASEALDGLAARLRHHVERFAEPRNIRAQPEANRQVGQDIADRFRTLGYTVAIQGRYRNVIATPAATPAVPPAQLIGAHYDSTPSTPGADDNASGLAAMLEVARLASSADAQVGFVAFNGEEDGLVGSRDFVSQLCTTRGSAPSAVHVLEMVGFASSEPNSQRSPVGIPLAPTVGDFIGVVSNHGSGKIFKHVMRTARATPEAPRVLGLRTYFGADRYVPDIHRSDHAPFWQVGIPALMWTDTANFRNPHYHRETDTPDTLDYDFLGQVTLLLARVVGVPEERACR